jgi:hypothetical protein
VTDQLGRWTLNVATSFGFLDSGMAKSGFGWKNYRVQTMAWLIVSTGTSGVNRWRETPSDTW